MADVSPARKLVAVFEKELTPPLRRMFSSGAFNEAVGTGAKTRSAVRDLVDSVAGRVWHAVNLPSSTDLQRVRELVAELDGEIRQVQRRLDEQSAPPTPQRKPPVTRGPRSPDS
jgi:hypothetical protein